MLPKLDFDGFMNPRTVNQVETAGHRNILSRSIRKADEYALASAFTGYDPYDTLTSPLPFDKLGKWAPILATQFQKRNPINIRPILRIQRARNPKGIGLFIHAYSLLDGGDQLGDRRQVVDSLVGWLTEHVSGGYGGACWGYNFPWASPVKSLDAWVPSSVVTGFICRGLFSLWRRSGREDVAQLLRGAAAFVSRDLPIYEDETGISFSYTPVMRDVCFNASLLAAEILARADIVSGEVRYRDQIVRAVEFVLARQKPDGRWNYSVDLDSGAERAQIDFHQGYVLESLHDLTQLTGFEVCGCRRAIERGLEFYRMQQFHEDGRSKWRLPKEWPVEIHNQAQGIITFSRLTAYGFDHSDFAEKIAAWTIANLQGQDGHFYYQKRRWFTNRIPFMRWSQGWMLLALATLASSQRSIRSDAADGDKP